MSNRFHNKWHRVNHHTYTNNNNPDAGHDPIASQPQPFLGEFVLSGALSAVAPLSAYAAHFYSNNTAICAIAGVEGIFVTGTQRAIQAFSENIALSAYSPKLGISVASPTRAISATAGFIGLDVFSANKAISARGLLIGLEVSSPVRAISASSNFIAGDFYSDNKAISARGLSIGLEVSSPVRAISASSTFIAGEFYSTNIGISSFGLVNGLRVESPKKAILANGANIGAEIFSNDRGISANGINIGGEFYSNNIALSSFGLVNGLRVESPQKAILATGSNIGAEIYSSNRGISANGVNIGLDVYSSNRGISANGVNIGGEFYSTNIPLSTAFGKNLLHGFVGINTNTPTSALEVVGDTVLYGNELVTGNVRINQNLTIYGNLSTLGDISYLDTHVTVTSAMDITNIGTGPALTVTQTGEQPVALFYDELGHPALYVEGTASKPGWVGVGNTNPSVALSVTGSISALSSLYINQNATIIENLSAFGHVRFTKTLSQGSFTDAIGNYSHAEGRNTVAKGAYSHAEGAMSTAAQDYTFIWSDGNTGTLTQNVSTTRTGQFMVSASGGTFIPGNMGIGIDLNTDKLSVGGNTTIYGVLSTTGNTIFSGNLSALSVFTPVISTQDINAYNGNGIIMETTSDVKIATFRNDGNTTIFGSISTGDAFLNTLSVPVSTTRTNNIVLDFSNNSYVICPIYTTTNIMFSSILPGKTIKAVLSSIAGSNQILNPDNRFIYLGAGRPTTLVANKVGYLQVESFGTSISSVVINYFAQN